MKVSVSTTQMHEASLLDQVAELVARRLVQDRARSKEVSDGERELGTAAGDLHEPDER